MEGETDYLDLQKGYLTALQNYLPMVSFVEELLKGSADPIILGWITIHRMSRIKFDWKVGVIAMVLMGNQQRS